jgi:glycosyltransferase involved in cell wall biosynthesis
VSTRIRVLHVIDSLGLGGAQAVLINLIRHGDKSRFEFEVATMHGRGVHWDTVRSLGVTLRSLSFNRHVPIYVPAIAWLCLTKGYDIVHTHLIGSNIIAKPIAALCGVSVRINHDHCNDKAAEPQRWIPTVDKLANRFSTHVIAVSESTREYLVNQEGLAADRVTTIYNGIDLSIYQPRPELRADARSRLQLPPDAFIIGGIGRLSYQKNFALFLEVAAAVLARQPSAYFVIAGTGDEDNSLREQAARLGISSQVRFLGFVSDMPGLYPALDMLLLTSRYEGLPITILEAMATRTAIVSSKLDGIQEVLIDGEDGALVPAGNAAEFAQRVCALIEQPKILDRIRVAALQKVQKNLSAQSVTRAVEAIYLDKLMRRL